jgi:hypothetical protein
LNVDHAAVFLRRGGKIEFQGDSGRVDELHGDHVRAKHRGFKLRGDIKEDGRGRGVSRDHHARKVAREEMPQFLFDIIGAQAAQVTELRGSKHLYSLTGKVIVKSGQGQAWSIDCRFANLSVETARGTVESQAEGLRMVRIEMPDGDVRDPMGCGGHLRHIWKFSPR